MKYLLHNSTALLFVPLLLLLVLSPIASAIDFTASDITGDTGSSFGAVMGDVNNDGALDIYVANFNNGQNKLWMSGRYTAAVVTRAASSIGTISADANGTLLFKGSPIATEHGFVWSTSPNPTISDSITQLGVPGSRGTFSRSITGLVSGTTYYYRAYATNPAGTSYGDNVQFTTVEIPDPDPETSISLRNTFNALDANGDGVLSLGESGLASLAELLAYDEDGDGDVTIVDLLELTVGPVGVATTVYVNFSNAGTEDGAAPATGFNTLLEAAVFVADSGTVSITAGSTNEVIYIDKAVRLEATGGTVTIGGTP